MEVRKSSHVNRDNDGWCPSAGPSRLGTSPYFRRKGLEEGSGCPRVRRGRVQAGIAERCRRCKVLGYHLLGPLLSSSGPSSQPHSSGAPRGFTRPLHPSGPLRFQGQRLGYVPHIYLPPSSSGQELVSSFLTSTWYNWK